MNANRLALIALVLLAASITVPASNAEAKKSGGYSSPRGSSSSGVGTGSKTQSYSVRPHVRKDGTYVQPHRRSTPDGRIENNWSTKPNVNPYTGKSGTK